MQNVNLMKLAKSPYIAFILVVTIFCFYMFPCVDSFYYFDWSQNLQLSYYDGPPLIAYTIKLITFIFGNSVFSLNFLGLIFALISACLIFKISELWNNQSGKLASLLWLVYPFGVIRFVITNVTYDGLECIFNLAIIYTVCLYLKTQNNRLIYLIGILAGFLLLSKYSGVILLISLILFFIVNKEYRGIFKKHQLYLSILICLIMFSPVIIWNYQHDWISFKYQLTTHLWSTDQYHNIHEPHKKWWQGILFYVWSAFFGSENILILFLAYLFFKKKLVIHQDPYLKLLIWLSISFGIFWLFLSPFAHVSLSYTLPLTNMLILLVSYFIVKYRYIKFYNILVIIFIIISLSILVGKCSIKKALKQACYQTTYNSFNSNCYNSYISNQKLKWYR